MFLISLRALRIENLPPPSPLIGVEQEGKSSFLVMGGFKLCFPVSLHPVARARKESVIGKPQESSSGKPNAIWGSSGWSSSFWYPPPNPLFPQECKPQDKKQNNHWALSYPVPPHPFFFLCFFFRFFLSFLLFRTQWKTPGDWGFNPFLW